MTREELIERLDLAVQAGTITLEEAREILALYDAGGIDPDELPLPVADGGNHLQQALIGLIPLAFFGYSYPARVSLKLRMLHGYDSSVANVALLLAERVPRIRQWHDTAGTMVRDLTHRLAELGAGRRLLDVEARAVRTALVGELAYLQRFADEISFRHLVGRPLSAARITDRLRQYGGTALGLFYRFAESNLQTGYIVRYIPVDDGGTCTPCHMSGLQGPYLPGRGPMPGEVCLARGKCRCHRQPEYNPREFQRLTRGR